MISTLLIYTDFQVLGLERAAEYNIDPPRGDPVLAYLLAIAERCITPKQVFVLNRLVRQNHRQEVLDYLIDANPFVREQIAALYHKADVTSEEQVSRLRHIQEEPARVGAVITNDDREKLDQMIRYAERLEPRTNTMWLKARELAARSRQGVIALVIGAAHSKGVADGFTRDGVPFAMIQLGSDERAAPGLANSISGPGDATLLPHDVFDS